MKLSVPNAMLCVKASLLAKFARAVPKSSTFTSPAAVSAMFDGLMSRC
jgi:hypothetical protein